MKNYQRTKNFPVFYALKSIHNRIFASVFLLLVILPASVLCQATGNKKTFTNENGQKAAGQSIVPLVDHHMHIWSENASSLIREPLMPVIELPDDLKRLLQDKEKFGGPDKNASALTDLYTKDVLVKSFSSCLASRRARHFIRD